MNRFLFFTAVLMTLTASSVLAQDEYPRAADVASPEAIITASYEAITRAPGEYSNWDRFRSLFIPEATLIPDTDQTGGETVILSPEGFVEWANAFFEQMAPIGSPEDMGFVEEAIHNSINRYGNIAQVFSAYQARFWEQEEVLGRGINSFQLVNRDGRWWIASIAWDEEPGAGPIPDRFLN